MTSGFAPWQRRTRAVLCLALATFVALPAAAQAAPDNDDFAAAQLVHVGDRVTGTIAGATTQAGEPATSSPAIGNTIWYRLTAAATERVRVDTCGRNPYSEVAVYTGAALGALTEVAQGAFSCTSGAMAYLNMTAGTTYRVRVAGYDWGADIALTVARPRAPANDLFAGAQALGLPAHITGTTVDATLEPGEPEPSPYGSGHSVWYRWTATNTGGIRASLCEDTGANAIVTIYTGTSTGTLSNAGIARSPLDVCGLSLAAVPTTVVGRTYYLSVRGNGDSADNFSMDVTSPSPPDAVPPGTAPPNPKCPFQLAAPGSVTYRGTHSGGGEVCITVQPDFKGITWFNLVDPPRDLCDIPFAVEHLEPAAPIAGRAFTLSTTWSRASGSFAGQAAHGTFQAVRSTENSTCTSRVLTWSAVTTATPPALFFDDTAPQVAVTGTRVQRPLRSRRVVVQVRCPKEACAAGASMTVSGIASKADPAALQKGRRRTLRLALSAKARRAIRSSLRSRGAIRARVVVIAHDAAGNRTRATRQITLRR